MSQIFAPLPGDRCLERMLCYYFNGTNKVQIVRITNVPNWYFDRVVFPQERLLFESLPEALLEIHESTPTGTTLSDMVSCAYLRVKENGFYERQQGNSIPSGLEVNSLLS